MSANGHMWHYLHVGRLYEMNMQPGTINVSISADSTSGTHWTWVLLYSCQSPMCIKRVHGEGSLVGNDHTLVHRTKGCMALIHPESAQCSKPAHQSSLWTLDLSIKAPTRTPELTVNSRPIIQNLWIINAQTRTPELTVNSRPIIQNLCIIKAQTRTPELMVNSGHFK